MKIFQLYTLSLLATDARLLLCLLTLHSCPILCLFIAGVIVLIRDDINHLLTVFPDFKLAFVAESVFSPSMTCKVAIKAGFCHLIAPLSSMAD